MFIYADRFLYYHSSACKIMSRLQNLALKAFQILVLIYCSNLPESAFPFLSLLTLFALTILAFPAILIFPNPFPPSIPTQIVSLSFRYLSYNSETEPPMPSLSSSLSDQSSPKLDLESLLQIPIKIKGKPNCNNCQTIHSLRCFLASAYICLVKHARGLF